MDIARKLGILALLEIGCGGAVEKDRDVSAMGGTHPISTESIHVDGGAWTAQISAGGAGHLSGNSGTEVSGTLQGAGGMLMATGGTASVAVTGGANSAAGGHVEQGGSPDFPSGASGFFGNGGTPTGGITFVGGATGSVFASGGSTLASGGSSATRLVTGGTGTARGGSSGAAGVDCGWTTMSGVAGFLNAEAYLGLAGAAGAPVAYGRALCKAVCAQQAISSYDSMYGTCAQRDCVCGSIGMYAWGSPYSSSHKTLLCASRLPWFCGLLGPDKHHPYPALACRNADLCPVDFPY